MWVGVMASQAKDSVGASGVVDETLRKKKQTTSELDGRLAKVELAMGDLVDSMGVAEQGIAELKSGMSTLEQGIDGIDSRVQVVELGVGAAATEAKEVVQLLVNEVADSIRAELAQLKENITGQLQAIKEQIDSVRGDLNSCKADVTLCKVAVAGGATIREGPRMKVPEPSRYEGKRDPKALDNFLWSVERYFEAMHVEDDASKICTATMYLSDDAVLWWRRRQEDIKKGLCSIATWDEFKRDLKRQFYPENVEELAMKKLRGLRQTGTIRDYISQYSSLMLEIPDMEEKTRLIFFMDGLQRWAEQELRRRGVKTLAEAIAVAESLIEIPRDSRRDKGKRVEEDDHEEEASLQQRVKYVDSTKDRTQSRGDSRDGGKQHKPLKCFLCDGPHMARACPTRQKLSAIIATLGEESATEASMGAMRLGEEAQLANIRLLNASEVVEEEPIREASTTTTGTGIKPGGSLMVVNGTVNEVHTRVLVDTGATHNFLALREAKNLGVKFTKVDGEMKAINSGATPVYGRAWNVPVRLGKWRGKIDFLVVDMDDESIVLGMEFLDSVMPIKMGDGVLTITNKGSECDIHLAKGKDADVRVSSLKATWALRDKRPGSVQGRIETSMPRGRHQKKLRETSNKAKHESLMHGTSSASRGEKATSTRHGQTGHARGSILTRTSRNWVGENVTDGIPRPATWLGSGSGLGAPRWPNEG